MIDKPGISAIDNHLEELRRQGIEALRCFNGTAGRLNLYKRYLALSKYYEVRLAGPFLIIKGGKRRACTDQDHPISILQERSSE